MPTWTAPWPTGHPTTPPFQDHIAEAPWDHVRSRGTLPLRARSMLTIERLAALGHDHERAMRVRAARTGARGGDAAAPLLRVAVSAGIPRAIHAFRIANGSLAAEAAAP